MLKVLGKASSINVRKVLWTCAELGIACEREDWGGGFRSTQTDEFRKLNPNAMVPVLIEDGFVLWESNTICRYLASSRQREDLLPQAARPRALVEKWMDWQATELNNSWRYAFMALVRKSPAHADPTQIQAGVAEWNRHIGILDEQLRATRAYAAGETFTLADIVLGVSVHRWHAAPFEKPNFPDVAAYSRRLGERPGFAKYGPGGGA